MQIKLVKTILALQPLFPIPVYFSVLTGHPPLLMSLIIAVMPMGIDYWYTRHIITRTPFDLPILIFLFGSLIGLIVAPDKGVATGALCSTIASILVYYGITNNRNTSTKYWLWTAGILCFITLSLSLWFLSQSERRVLFFNQWAFNLFSRFPKTVGPVLNLHTIAGLLSVVIPALFIFAFYKTKLRIRIIAFTFCLLFIGILFLSDSGTGWLAAFFSLAFILVCWRRWLLFVFIPAVGLLTTGAVIFYDKIFWLQTTISTFSLMARTELWRNTIILLKGKAAILGLGQGAWFYVYGSRYGNTLDGNILAHVHNSYLQLYCDAGILGLIAMILAAIIFTRLSINLLKVSGTNSINWIGIGLIGSIIAGAVFAIFDVNHTITYVTETGYIYLALPLLWIGAALISVMSVKRSVQPTKFLWFLSKNW